MVSKFFLARVILIFLFFGSFSSKVSADIIYLKNGHSLEGIVKSEDNDRIELEVCFGTVKFEKDQIEKISFYTLEEKQRFRQKCAEQRMESQRKIQGQKQQEVSRPKHIEFSQEQAGMVLEVVLNRRINVSLILDTGASLVMLRKHVAQELGIDLEKVKEEIKLKLADGREVQGKLIFLENVRIGTAEADKIEAAVLLEEIGDIGETDGLLGMSFLKKFNFKVDYQNKRLILERL